MSWLADENGNPSVLFSGGSSTRVGAIYPTVPTLLHNAGNDRVSALAFSDGSVVLRQDEGGAKLLSLPTTNASAYQFRGGVGFVSDRTAVVACSAIDGTVGIAPAAPLQLILGMGYVRKSTSVPALAAVPALASTAALHPHASTAALHPEALPSLEHTVLAPWGGASFVLSIATLRNASASTSLWWTEAWAAGSRWELGWGADASPTHSAAAFQARWGHDFVVVRDSHGAPVGLADAAFIVGAPPRPPAAAPPTPALHDPSPRAAFWVCVSCLANSASLRSFTTSGPQLYCAGGRGPCADASVDAPFARPGVGAIVPGLDNSTAAAGEDSIVALQAAFSAGGDVAFAVGYLTAEDEAADSATHCEGPAALAACVLRKTLDIAAVWELEGTRTGTAWRAGANSLEFGAGAARSADQLASRAAAAQDPAAAGVAAAASEAAAAAADATSAAGPAAPRASPSWSSWEGREAAWHSYALRASLSFDSFYDAHTLNQGGNYLLISGMQAAARDPLAHVMGLGWAGRSAEGFVVEVVRYTLREKRTAEDARGRPAGGIPWGRAAFGEDASGSFNASDLELNALFTLSQYVLATRDAALLAQPVGGGSGNVTVGAAAFASFEHLRTSISTGAHGLIRLLLSDHNDGLLGGLGVPESAVIMADGESVMNGALAAYVLELFAEALELAGWPTAQSASVRALGDAQRAAVRAQWATLGDGGGGWYRRAWLGGATNATGWRGAPETDGTTWTETQSWALLGRVPDDTPGRAAALVAHVDAVARTPSPIGAINTAPDTTVDGGVGYGGVWACGDVALVTALGLRGWQGLALDEWRKSSLAGHADAYPGIWFGVTGGSDVWNSVYSAQHGNQPGSTRCHWNNPGTSLPCEELASPVGNVWTHTLGTYPLPALVGAEWDAHGLTLRPPLLPEDEYALFTPLVSLSHWGGADTCAFAGHWAPALPSGALLTIRIDLGNATRAHACTTLAVNGQPPHPVQFDPSNPAVVLVVGATADVGMPASPLLSWQLA